MADLDGLAYVLYDEAGHTEISLARESIFQAFLKSDCSDLVFIDDDVMWERGGLIRLLEHDVDLVAGAYPKRKDPIEWSVGWLDVPELRAVNGLLEVASLATGFMRISRNCAEKMHKEYGATVFDNIRHDTGRYSEDISFCRRWRDIGGKVWLDPEIKMGHIGNKLFSGTIGEFLRNRT